MHDPDDQGRRSQEALRPRGTDSGRAEVLRLAAVARAHGGRAHPLGPARPHRATRPSERTSLAPHRRQSAHVPTYAQAAQVPQSHPLALRRRRATVASDQRAEQPPLARRAGPATAAPDRRAGCVTRTGTPAGAAATSHDWRSLLVSPRPDPKFLLPDLTRAPRQVAVPGPVFAARRSRGVSRRTGERRHSASSCL